MDVIFAFPFAQVTPDKDNNIRLLQFNGMHIITHSPSAPHIHRLLLRAGVPWTDV